MAKHVEAIPNFDLDSALPSKTKWNLFQKGNLTHEHWSPQIN